MIAGVREAMLESIRLRLRADVPVGVYLSGGIDSSVIAGMVTHLVTEQGEKIGNEKELERVSCFSIAFDEESGFDESCEWWEVDMRLSMLKRICSHRRPYRQASERQVP